MESVLKSVVSGYHYINEDLSDPRTKNWFMIGSPWPGLALLIAYLYFVFNLGPKFMEKRKSYNLVRAMQVYNLMQVIFNMILFYRALQLGWLWDFSYSCQPVDFSLNPRAVQMAETCWYYFMVKILDLLDTVFFVLRKKQNHVTFLHVYHHVGMVLASWGATKYMGDGNTTFLGLVNTFVHAIMYCYYLIATQQRTVPKWKRRITQLQLLQFFLVLMHATQILFLTECGYPKWPSFILIPQNIFMVTLFLDFYYRAYVKPSKRPAETNGVPAEIAKDAKTQ